MYGKTTKERILDFLVEKNQDGKADLFSTILTWFLGTLFSGFGIAVIFFGVCGFLGIEFVMQTWLSWTLFAAFGILFYLSIIKVNNRHTRRYS